MDSFMHVSGWSEHLPPHSRPFGHVRSLSSVPTTTSSSASYKPRPPPKSISTSNLPIISLSSKTAFFPNNEMSTLPDPRTRVLSPSQDNSPATASPSPSGSQNQHPDLSDEVATLSTKLINAINHQTVLDDSLSATRHELEAARSRIRELEAQVDSQRQMMTGDVWVRRSTLENERKAMQVEKRAVQLKLTEETTKRQETEKDKRKIEQELENLTAALFEEANKMVIGAKEEAKQQQDVLEKKNDQLKSQLADSESLLKSQQEQLSELKQVLETMVMERDDQTNNTAPSSPGVARFDAKDDTQSVPEVPTTSTAVPAAETHSPAPPTSFTHLLQPVLRNDLAAYDDFVTLAHLSRQRSGSRVSSGSIGALVGLGGSTSSAHPSNASTTSLSTFSNTATNSAPQSPNTPASVTSTVSTPSAIPHLKDTRFFKRVLSEDVEPTLRLDTAPGLSWLARRTVISAVADGSLVVEPVPASTSYIQIAKPQFYPCSLCGENRREEAYLRTYRFRTSEAETAQRYPLCGFCTSRVRSTCQFMGFLRMIKDGYWRADDEDHEKAAWEESVRLREQMFWCRIGGGVIPIPQAEVHTEPERSPRQSQEAVKATDGASAEQTTAIENPVENPPLDDDDDSSNYEFDHRISVDGPHTPPDQTDGVRPLRYSVQSLKLDTMSNSGSDDTKRLSSTTMDDTKRVSSITIAEEMAVAANASTHESLGA